MLSSTQGLQFQRTGLEALGSEDLEAYQTLAGEDMLATTISEGNIDGEIGLAEVNIEPLSLPLTGTSNFSQEILGSGLDSLTYDFDSIGRLPRSAQPTLTSNSNTSTPVSHLPSCACFVHQGGTNNRFAAATTNQVARANGVTSSNGVAAIPALNAGTRWTGNTITYSFFSGGSYYGSETGVRSLSAGAQNLARQIFADIQSLINVNFVEVADSANSYGDVRLMASNGTSEYPNEYAYAYYPSTNPLGGDVHLNPNYDNANNSNGFQTGIGSHGYMALVHEIGHALGLKHTGDYSGDGSDAPFLSFGEDNSGNTVMSYNFTGNSAATFMPYDVYTLQNLYGARATNAGDTVYSFATPSYYSDGSVTRGNGNATKLTIWDSGGTDLLDFRSLVSNSGGYRFDLNDGGWLSTLAGFNTLRYNALGDASYTPYVTTATGTRLAFGASIENLIGTVSNDEITGNSLNNTLWGNSGNDAIYAGAGNDILLGGYDSDLLVGGAGVDEFIIGGGSQPFYAQGIDTIYDLTAGERISLSKSTFTTLGSGIGYGFSIGSEFGWSYGAADTSSALVVYDRNTGGLFYNPNGAVAGYGGGGQFAVVTANPNLYATDFSIIA
jgi:Ca2+-binding RTX toxin-like protein